MNSLELLGPLAWGGPGTAQLKACAEDFQVDEVLDIPLSEAASTCGYGWKSVC